MSNIVPVNITPPQADNQVIETYRMKISHFNLLMKILSHLPGPNIWIKNNILHQWHEDLIFKCDLYYIKPYNKEMNFFCRMDKKHVNQLKLLKSNNDVLIEEYDLSYKIIINDMQFEFEKDFKRLDDVLPKNNEINNFTNARTTNETSNFLTFIRKKKFFDFYIADNMICKIKDDSNVIFEFINSSKYQYILRVFYFLKISSTQLTLRVKQIIDKDHSAYELDNILYDSLYLVTIYTIHPNIFINQAEKGNVIDK